MAIIGEIRKRPGVLVGVIALSIVLFLLGVAVNDQFSVLRPGGNRTDAGSVDGQTITYNDYSKELSENIKNVESQQKMSLNDQQRNYMSQQTWDEMVNKIIMDHTSKKTGLAVSDDEMVSLTMTENLHPMIRQQLFGNNPVDVAGLNNFIRNLDVDDKGQEHGLKRRFWNNIVKEVKKSQLQNKYSVLVAKGVGNVPKWEAEDYYTETGKTADFKYVELPYTDVNDNDIKYTDNDLKDYLNKNAAMFTAPDESRKIQYVAFDIIPSTVDSATALKALTDRLEEFTKGATKSDDSLFVKLYSETPFVDLYKTKDMPGNQIPDSLFSRPTGTVVGPYVENGMYKFAKVSARKMMSDSVRVREISFQFANLQEADQKVKAALADSIFKAIDSLHGDFAAFAAAYSDDPTAKTQGGDIGWVNFNDPSKDEQYKNIVFHNGEKGKTYKYFDGQSMLKYVQIEEEHPSKEGVKIAYYTHSLLPSQETENEIYSNVTQFASANASEEKFKKYAKDHPADIKTAANITKESYDVTGLQSARPVVKWTFDAKRGDVSPIKTIDNGGINGRKHVIAYLESITGKGTPDLESVKDAVKFYYLRDKKYELLAKKITDAKAAGIDDLGAKLGKTVQTAEHSVFANPNLPSGNEPSVVAEGVYIAQGKLSGPIKGNQGVYAVEKIAGVDPPAPTDLSRQTMMLQQAGMSKARVAQEALKKQAKVSDNRLFFEGN